MKLKVDKFVEFLKMCRILPVNKATRINRRNVMPIPAWLNANGMPITPEPIIEFIKLKLVPDKLLFVKQNAFLRRFSLSFLNINTKLFV